ncbi:PD-(D/E)XK nuclease family protein [Halalkalicoccus salilacus]|uniref:PD-(D/E)XK nuclease family protein n=1 Tax=Halalkalicoccus salilacus TaxID=3117459 RepID=UPI00300EAF28
MAGPRGGKKTLYGIHLGQTSYGKDAFLSIWHENPSWTDNFGATNQYVIDILEEVPLRDGETVLARGVPNVREEKWYFNVTSLLIRDPDTLIGKSEMRSASECPRIYDLAFNKKVYSPGRYDLSPGAIKGRIAHSVLEYAVEDETYGDLFELGWSEEAVESCLSEVLENKYAIELALCRLAWISTNRIEEHAIEALKPLLTDDEFTTRVAEASDISTEVALSSALGFNGRVDLLLDGVPYDLKTTYQPTESQRQKNRFQLRIYLLALTLETLGPGESLDDRIDSGVEGVLVYPSLVDSDTVEIEEVELRERDVKSILRLRNEAVVLRNGFGTPTTYGRDCEGCMFKEPTSMGAGDVANTDLPPPCQFYCQSERRWDCFETDESGEVISQCPLFDQCEQRLDFRDPKVTDHYNQLRNALNAEREQRRDIGVELEHLADDTLTKTGLLVPELTLTAVEGQRRLHLESVEPVVPTFSPGDEVRLQHSGTEYYQKATYFGRDSGEYVFQLDTNPIPMFLDPTATFEARHTLAVDTLPRQLLSQLDYAQRAEVTPLIESIGVAGDALESLAPEDIVAVADHNSNKELYINVPVRLDRTEIVTSILESLSMTPLPAPDGKGTISDEEQRVLVLCSDPKVMDALTGRLSSNSGIVRMDGFAGGNTDTITPLTDAHQIYTSLEDSSAVVTSTQYALKENVFHAMQDGDDNVREHTGRFFDAVVLSGAETLTEPQFHFLRVLGDRIFAVGDVHRSGPEMVSGEAQDSRLAESYFTRLYRRFANVSNPDSQSLTLPAELTAKMTEGFSSLDIPISTIEGDVNFVDTEGATESVLSNTTLEYQFPCDTNQHEPRFLRLRPTEDVDATQIASAFDHLRSLDAQEFTVQNTYIIQDIQFEVKTNNPIDADEHHVKVQIPVRSTPFLNRLLTHNPREAAAVVEVCAEENPEAVVTPFIAHANKLRKQLGEAGLDIPVLLPNEFSGEQLESTVVSLGVSDERRMVVPPVSRIETLYTILNSGKSVIVVGDKQTLERNSLLSTLLR